MAKIMVVDDEPAVRDVIELTLSTAGHDVVKAADGEQALKLLKKNTFELMILDIMMPGMSGYDVLEKLQEMPAHAEMKVIVVTAKHDPEGVLRETSTGAVDHLAKPFLPEELESAVERALSSTGRREERRQALQTEAEVYGSMDELFKQARESDP